MNDVILARGKLEILRLYHVAGWIIMVRLLPVLEHLKLKKLVVGSLVDDFSEIRLFLLQSKLAARYLVIG